MMRATIVYESMYGHTRAIAEAIGDGIARHADVRVVSVGQVETEAVAGVGLLVVGGPTHVRGMSRPATRQDAVRRAAKSALTAEEGAAGPGLREWLSVLDAAGLQAAAFDTRIQMNRLLTGAASRAIAHLLARRGARLVARPESFLVTKNGAALVAGETERARAWGQQLAEANLARQPS
jgi:hypothetical protein